MHRSSRIAVVVLALGLGSTVGPAALADAPPPASDPALAPLLARLATHAQSFEEMKKRGSFTASGKVEELDGKGHIDATREMVLKVTATPAERQTEIVKYLEDGEDKTVAAREKMRKEKAEKDDKKKKRDIRLPFLPSEAGHYTFAIAERSGTRARVTFTPKETGEEIYRGSAWVEESTGEVLTLGFAPSKTPFYVDHVDITMRFDHATPLGRAPSSVSFDAKGGFLVIHKHYRGNVAILDPRIAF